MKSVCIENLMNEIDEFEEDIAESEEKMTTDCSTEIVKISKKKPLLVNSKDSVLYFNIRNKESNTLIQVNIIKRLIWRED